MPVVHPGVFTIILQMRFWLGSGQIKICVGSFYHGVLVIGISQTQ